MPQRVLSEQEFESIKKRVLSTAPELKDEAEFHRWAGPAMEQALGEAENSPAPHEGSAMGRFVSGAADMLNPVAAVKGVWNAAPIPQALGGSGVIEGPKSLVKAAVGAMGNEWSQAKDAYKQGRYSEAIGHGAAGTIPLIGPIAGKIGTQIGEGDVAGGLGELAGLTAPVTAGPLLKGARAAIPAAAREAIATGLESGAAKRYTEVMAPKVGANKTRFGRMAEEVAPDLAQDPTMGALSRSGLHGKVADRLAQAEQALDEAHDSRLNARTFETRPMLEALARKRKEFEAQAVEGSRVGYQGRRMEINPESGEVRAAVDGVAPGGPIGRSVVPAPNHARVGMINQAMNELRQLGPVTRYDEIRKLRQAYDGPAKAIYSPSMTADFLKAQGGKMGAADVTSVLRDQLATWDPATAEANGVYTLYRKADDVLQATAEVERTRPKLFRQVMARITGTLGGGQMAGAAGAVGGFILAPILDSAASSGATTKLVTGQLMTNLARAIRAGDMEAVTGISAQLEKAVAAGNQPGTALMRPETGLNQRPKP